MAGVKAEEIGGGSGGEGGVGGGGVSASDRAGAEEFIHLDGTHTDTHTHTHTRSHGTRTHTRTNNEYDLT